MRAARFERYGGPEVLEVVEVPKPSAGEGEVLVRVRAAALNHLDIWARRGVPAVRLPHIGGSDIAGEIQSVHGSVAGWSVGDRVVINPLLTCGRCAACAGGDEPLCSDIRILGEHTDGGLAEYVAAPASALHSIPANISFETAAALPVSYQTAWRAVLGKGRLRAGEDVLVMGASGGTAVAAVQIAGLHGARIFAVTSSPEKVARLTALGADFVYDRTRIDFGAQLHRDTGKRGVDLVIENVGAATWKASVRALARGGRLVTYGATTGFQGDTDLRLLFWKQLELLGTTMAAHHEFESMLHAVFSGALSPVIDSVFPLREIRAAHERLEGGAHFGKILVLP